MRGLDQTDKQIVHLLENDATKSSASLAKVLSLSQATVRRRIRKLVKNGVIRITAIVDPGKAGFYLVTCIALNVDPDKINLVLESLRHNKDVRWVAVASGRFNIIMLCRFSSTEEFHLFIQDDLSKLQGLENIETYICLRLEKGRYM